MLKLTKTGIGLLTKQYRSVLRKCLLINVGLFVSTIFLLSSEQQDALATIAYENYDRDLVITTHSSYYTSNGLFLKDTTTGGMVAQLFNDGNYSSAGTKAGAGSLDLYSQGILKTILNANYFALNDSGRATGIDFASNVTAGTTNASHLATTGAVNQLLNYYYTFRVDERVEAIEFAKELRSNKKEMSSLDFMPIKSSSDLRIKLIKAEDPLTFSAKTRDDSLVLNGGVLCLN